MNIGYEDDELKPYTEKGKDQRDERRILTLQTMGYTLSQVHEALDKERFEEIHATYLLLAEKKQLENAKTLENSSQSATIPQQQQAAGDGTGASNISPSESANAQRYPGRSSSAQVQNNIRPSRRASHIEQIASTGTQQVPSTVTSAAITVGTTGAPTSTITSTTNAGVNFRQGFNPRQPAMSMQPHPNTAAYVHQVQSNRQQPATVSQAATRKGSGNAVRMQLPMSFGKPGANLRYGPIQLGVPVSSKVVASSTSNNGSSSARGTSYTTPSTQLQAAFVPQSAKLAAQPKQTTSSTSAANGAQNFAIAQLQKSGSVSHAPREPSIKEDEDETNETTTVPQKSHFYPFSSSGSAKANGSSSTADTVTTTATAGSNGHDSERSSTPQSTETRPSLHPSPSMPPTTMLKNLTVSEVTDPKMTKSATGNQISTTLGATTNASVLPSGPQTITAATAAAANAANLNTNMTRN